MSSTDAISAGTQKMLVEQLTQQLVASADSSDSDFGATDDTGSTGSATSQFSSLFAQTLADAVAPAKASASTSGGSAAA